MRAVRRIRKRVLAFFETLLERAEQSNPWHLVPCLIAGIVIFSALLMSLFWQLFSNSGWWDVQSGMVELAVTSSALVAVIVATPAVIFGHALLKRTLRVKADLRRALLAADVANRAKTEFLANMSHEIRTPLNGVLGMAQVLEASELTAHQREALRTIGESGELLLGIIADVLDLSKIEFGQISLEPMSQPLAKLLGDTVRLFEARAAENRTEVVFGVDAGVPEQAVFDSVRVRQCLANLVSNAVKFTLDGRVEVWLSAEAAGTDWKISLSVKDNGVGISPEVQKRLFKPFEQAESTTARTFGGTGLGLAIARRLARAMGGDITLDSAHGKGSTFVLTFSAGRVMHETLPSVALKQNEEQARQLEGCTILVVDDSRVNRHVVLGLLKPYGPHCIEADNGAAALAVLSDTKVDLIVLDMQMPVMNGPETLKALRALDGPVAQTPVIALTADVMNGRKVDYLKLGYQGFLSKPLCRTELLAEVCSVTGWQATREDQARQPRSKVAGSEERLRPSGSEP